jgi:hypothetical protein
MGLPIENDKQQLSSIQSHGLVNIFALKGKLQDKLS